MTGRGSIVALCATLASGIPAPVHAGEQPVGQGFRTRGLTGGWGHSWRPLFGKTRSDISFVAFDPRMGWFVTDRLELYGEGTLFFRTHHISNAGTAGQNLGINAATVLAGVEWGLRPPR